MGFFSEGGSLLQAAVADIPAVVARPVSDGSHEIRKVAVNPFPFAVNLFVSPASFPRLFAVSLASIAASWLSLSFPSCGRAEETSATFRHRVTGSFPCLSVNSFLGWRGPSTLLRITRMRL